jgi:hypothetical protein
MNHPAVRFGASVEWLPHASQEGKDMDITKHLPCTVFLHMSGARDIIIPVLVASKGYTLADEAGCLAECTYIYSTTLNNCSGA